ncbi:trypsin-like peptidase domain-containing protein, partial [Planobispora rosea]|uniref:P-loop NTPase n=1 Tax=Planobispora rosea TaxID=35762 RepID=UPI00083B7975
MQLQRIVAVTGPADKGSGYVVAPRLVLTCAHVSGPVGTSVKVFRPGREPLYDGQVAWAGSAGGRDDAALVAVTDPAWQPVDGPAVRWGRTVTYRPGIECTIWGRPDLAQRPGRPTDTWQKRGRLNPGSGAVNDLYTVELDAHPPNAPESGGTPWAGMSGAGLVCGQLLAGVIMHDPAPLAHSALQAVPAYVLHQDPGFRAVLTEHTGRERTVLEPIEWQELIDPPDVVPSTTAPVASPAGLLKARRAVVPFTVTGREQILQELHSWARRPGFGAFLLHGAGGQGKTRLAQYLSDELSGGGWAVAWLKADAPASELEVVADTHTPIMIVIDYAESRTGQLTALLNACARRGGTSRVKLLLLARTAGTWWQELTDGTAENLDGAAGDLLAGTPVRQLSPLQPEPDDQRAGYQKAATAFAAALSTLPGWRDPPWAQLAASLPGPRPRRRGLDNALTLHMSALSDLLDAADPALLPAGESDDVEAGTGQVEDRMLAHERRYWKATAQAFPHELRPALSMATLTGALAAATTLGAADDAEADALLVRVPGLSDQTEDRRRRVRSWIAALYPASPTVPGTAFGRVPWGSLQPDRLTERLWGRCVQTDPTLAERLVAAADPAVPERLKIALSPQQAIHLLTVYARAAAHPVFSGGLDEQLTGLCVRHRRVLAEPAIEVATQVEAPGPLLLALSQLVDDPAMEVADLQRWSDRLPHSTHVLADWAARLTERLTGHYRTGGDLPDLAASLNNQAIRLGDLGRHEEALEAITEATGLYRALATARPKAFLPNLAASLNNQANRLGDLGRHEEALEAITE